MIINMSKKYLTEHPQVYKRKTYPTPLIRNEPLPAITIEQTASELINKERQLINELEEKLQKLEKSNQVLRNSLEFYDPELESNRLAQKLEELQKEEKYLNQQIEDCQKVQNQLSSEEYFLWKKKQRVESFDTAIDELYDKIDEEKEDLEMKINDNNSLEKQILEECYNISSMIESYALQKHAESIFENPAPTYDVKTKEEEEQDQIRYEELIGENIQLNQKYNQLTNDIEILNENTDILSRQFVDGINSIEFSLNSFFENQKNKLQKDLKMLRAENEEKEVGPLSKQQSNYKIDPLYEDYAYKMKQIEKSIPEDLKECAENLVRPLEWDSVNWMLSLEEVKNKSHVYDQYREVEVNIMESQIEINKYLDQLKEIGDQTANTQQKHNQILIGIVKMTKMLAANK